MTKINLKELTDKHRQAWIMRYRYGWRMKRIALELGTSKQAVSALLQRAHLKAGLPRRKNLRIVQRQPRLVRAASLSNCYNY